LVFVGQVALAQLETVADLNFGTGYIQPGQAQVTQKVALVDSDDDNADHITISQVQVENVLGTAVPTDFALVEILDGNNIVKGSVSFPTSYPIIISIPGWIIPDNSSDTLQVRVTVAPGVIGHRTIRTRVRISYTESGTDYVAIADDGNATIINNPPVAADDASYSVNEDNTLTVAAPGVLGNDSDPDGDTLTAVLVSGPSHGTLTLNSDGSFTYTPAENFFGTDSFTYQAYDGVAYSNVATVTITVSSVNDAPVAEDDSYHTDEDTPLVVTASGVLGNDSDVEGDPLTAVLVSGPSHGTLTLNPNGSFTYTPAGDYYGSDSFKYKARDSSGAESNEATVTITVNPVPYSARRTLPIGWNMISVPLKPIPPNNTPGAVFGDDITPLLIYRWNPNTNAYDANPSPIDPGHGYWVYIMTQDTEIDVDGTRIDFDYEVPLGKAGWHMISTPTVNVYWGYCKFTDGTTTKTYTEAIAAGWIAPYIFRWDPATNSYTSYGASGVIEPWVGYWIRTYVDNLTLILPVYDAIHSPPVPPTSLLVPSAAELGLTPPAPPVLPFTDKKTGFMVLNYPNPIRDVHTTKFMVLGAEVETIRVSIYDLSGRLVWRGEAPGNELTWHTDDLSGQFLANGVYLYIVEIKVGGQWIRTDVKKLVILR
jgi:VCBS repeat-containing protein